jgi:hypothetical protein
LDMVDRKRREAAENHVEAGRGIGTVLEPLESGRRPVRAESLLMLFPATA